MIKHTERALTLLILALILILGARQAAPWLSWAEVGVALGVALGAGAGVAWLMRRGK